MQMSDLKTPHGTGILMAAAGFVSMLLSLCAQWLSLQLGASGLLAFLVKVSTISMLLAPAFWGVGAFGSLVALPFRPGKLLFASLLVNSLLLLGWLNLVSTMFATTGNG